MRHTTGATLTYDRLPEPPIPASFLYCWKCGGEYSATRGDYFWARPGAAPKCSWPGHRRPIRLRLVRRLSRLVEVGL